MLALPADPDAPDEYDGDQRAETERVGYFDRPVDDPDDHPAGLPAESQRPARSAGPSAGQAWAAVIAASMAASDPGRPTIKGMTVFG